MGVGAGGGGRISQHPTDRLIRELIVTGREATSGEVAAIVERMATALFDRRLVPVPTRMRGVSYQGCILGAREDSLAYHLVKRVLEERQWAEGTTAGQYVTDLRRAVCAADQLAVYERRGGPIAATVTPTSLVLSVEQLGESPYPLILVVYSADRGIITSGYQISGLETAGIPEEALWLK
jgi:hypothetical protein